jgi:hypothetical protein
VDREYAGKERRVEAEPGKVGRRNYDWHCGEHALIQESTKSHRAAVCGKIAAVEAEIRQAVSWKVFAFLLGFAVMVLGAGFGHFAKQLDRVADKQEWSATQIKSTLDEIQQSQAVMRFQINAIKERQDILRDAHMRDQRKGGGDG